MNPKMISNLLIFCFEFVSTKVMRKISDRKNYKNEFLYQNSQNKNCRSCISLIYCEIKIFLIKVNQMVFWDKKETKTNEICVHTQKPVLRFRRKTEKTPSKFFISSKWLCYKDTNLKASFSLASFNHKPYGRNLFREKPRHFVPVKKLTKYQT